MRLASSDFAFIATGSDGRDYAGRLTPCKQGRDGCSWEGVLLDGRAIRNEGAGVVIEGSGVILQLKRASPCS